MNVTLKVYLLSIAVLITFIGNTMHIVAISWLALTFSESALGIGIVGISSTLPYLIFLKLASKLSSTGKTGAIAVISDLTRGALIILVGIVIIIKPDAYILLYIIPFILSSLGVFFLPAYMATIPIYLENNESLIVKFNSLSSIAFQAGGIIGAGLAAVLLTIITPEILFILDGITFIIAAYILYILKFHKTIIKERKEEQTTSTKYSNLKKMLLMISIATLASLPQVIASMFNYLGPILGKKLTNSPIFFAQMDVVFAVGATVSGMAMFYLAKGNIPYNKRMPFMSILGVLIFLMLMLSNKLIILIICFAIGLATTYFAIIMRSFIQLKIDNTRIGFIFSVKQAFESIFVLLLSLSIIVLPKQFTNLELSVVIIPSALIILLSVILTPLIINARGLKNEE